MVTDFAGPGSAFSGSASYGFAFSDFARPGFTLPAELEAHDPPEARGVARDDVRLLVSRRAAGQVTHHRFGDLPELLLPGDLLVVNNTATLPAQVRADGGLAVHFSGPAPDGAWLVELREIRDKISIPNGRGYPGQVICLPGGAELGLLERATARLWRARLSVAVVPYLLRHGVPIRYSYVPRDWGLPAYQTVFAQVPGSAEMPSASRPFTPAVVTGLVSRGVLIAPLTLHCGVSSLEADEDPYPEPYDVPPATAALVNHVRARGGRIIAAGTTVVRALETAARVAPAELAPAGTLSVETVAAGTVTAAAGWTSHVVTPETGVSVVDGLLTGLHEPRSSHLRMLAAFAGPELLGWCYTEAIRSGYLWHEFGDVHLMLP
jgi:S-adenosylmethionine:tRNA-ribosyltransferase-isomerase (queuine synthetase)